MFEKKKKPGNKTRPEHMALGDRGEDVAAAFFKGLGYFVLARNWRPDKEMGVRASAFELDLIARDGDTLVFAEVKTRRLKPGSAFTPADNFSALKKGRLRKAISYYLTAVDGWELPCRADLITIALRDGESPGIEHYKNVL